MFFGLLWILCFPSVEPSESDEGISCSVCAVTSSLSTLALLAMCSLLYLWWRGHLWSAVHHLFDRLFDHQHATSGSSDDVLDGESDNNGEASSLGTQESCADRQHELGLENPSRSSDDDVLDGNSKALAELCTTSDNNGEASSLGTQENYPDPSLHSYKDCVTSFL